MNALAKQVTIICICAVLYGVYYKNIMNNKKSTFV